MKIGKTMGIVGKITLLVISVVTFSVAALIVIGFNVNFKQVDEAAGVELIGCANITSGLVNTDEIKELIAGNQRDLAKVEKEIDWIVDHKPIFKNAAIMTTGGKLLAVDKRLKEQGFQAGDSFYVDQKAMEMLTGMKHPAYTEIYQFGGAGRKTGYAPIFAGHDSQEEIIAVMAIDFDSSIIKERTWNMLMFTLQSGGAFPLISAAIAYLLIRRMVGPLRKMNGQVKQIAEGNLSLEKLSVASKDEIGELAHSFNIMVANLTQIVGSVRKISDEVAASSCQMAASTVQVTTGASEVAGNTQQLAHDAENGNEAILEASLALLELSSLVQIAKIKATSAENNSNVTLKTASEGKQVVIDSMLKMENIKSRTMETEQLILTLDQYSKEIGQITKTMSEIASQTNLLALNAAIEAARAGEAGRGFAVVASEVRKLSEQSNREAAQVAELIRKIMETTAKAVAATYQSRLEVEKGTVVVTKAGHVFDNILQAVDSTVEEVQAIVHVTNDEVATSEKIVKLINELATFIETAAANAEEISASTEQTSALMHGIAASTEQLNIMASELQSSVEVFKL